MEFIFLPVVSSTKTKIDKNIEKKIGKFSFSNTFAITEIDDTRKANMHEDMGDAKFTEKTKHTVQPEQPECTKHMVEHKGETSAAKLYVIIYVLAFIVVLCVIAIATLAFLYRKQLMKKPKQAIKPKRVQGPALEPELSVHDYEPVLEYIEVPNPVFQRNEYDRLHIASVPKPNSPALRHYHNAFVRQQGIPFYQNSN